MMAVLLLILSPNLPLSKKEIPLYFHEAGKYSHVRHIVLARFSELASADHLMLDTSTFDWGRNLEKRMHVF